MIGWIIFLAIWLSAGTAVFVWMLRDMAKAVGSVDIGDLTFFAFFFVLGPIGLLIYACDKGLPSVTVWESKEKKREKKAQEGNSDEDIRKFAEEVADKQIAREEKWQKH